MKKSSNKVFWSIVTVLLGILCIAAVIKSSGQSPKQLLGRMEGADPKWLAAAVICTLGCIYFEGKAVLCLLKDTGWKRSERQGFVYASADVYFSAITPSATGGQPASAFFMMRDGVPAPVATAVLLANLVMYNAAILSIGFLCLLIFSDLFWHFQLVCRCLVIAGIVVLAALGFLFVMLLRHQKPLFHMTMMITNLLHRMHILRDPSKIRSKLEKAMEEYRDVVKLMAGKKSMWLKAYFCNVMQRVCQFSVAVCTFLAIGGKTQLLRLWATQCYVSLGSNCVPIPGSMGVTDYMMIDGYMNLMNENTAYTLQLMARGLSFYCCVMVSALVILVAFFVGNAKRRKMQSKG